MEETKTDRNVVHLRNDLRNAKLKKILEKEYREWKAVVFARNIKSQ